MRILIVAMTLLWSTFSFAHARLKASNEVMPRSTNAGVKVGPCGGYARAVSPPVLAPGQTITVNWEEVIDHPGRYEFYFSSASDQNFMLLATIPDTATGALPHQYTTQLTLPNVTCTDCTLQMIQVMTENPNMPSLYFSCADMKLEAGAQPTATPAPTATPVATPLPPMDCN